ncbi:MAG TPA: alternative ribosome rescue aminoacyl-tRNA hydrolase ArfB [Gemmatimonadota bacterium]|nr:alternative ribosome rescue aminoacyl-tRNA hydrolase ArfB [Gemmatimonadota bacterium]
MVDEAAIPISDGVSIPRSELTYRATRSGGPGGQHVNTSSTRVELKWDVAGSPSLTAEQRELVLRKLANRIDGEGVLRLVESGTRSQHRNREVVTERLGLLVAEALRVPKKRKRTRPSRAAREERLSEKKRRGETKRLRGPVEPPE